MTTTHVRAAELEERWLLFDASEQPLGRMAARIAQHLMGKDRPTYTPSELTGAHVVVIHAEKAVLTGRKAEQKSYQFYSGYPGGLKEIPFERMRERRPADLVTLAVKRMLPKTRLGRQMLKRLKVYAGAEHPHGAQRPEPATVPRRAKLSS
jgi:large subunit ribosomal protein L13